MKIKSIKKLNYKGYVYNLTVKDDESYFANQISVHNCRSILVPITKFEDYKENPKADFNEKRLQELGGKLLMVKGK